MAGQSLDCRSKAEAKEVAAKKALAWMERKGYE